MKPRHDLRSPGLILRELSFSAWLIAIPQPDTSVLKDQLPSLSPILRTCPCLSSEPQLDKDLHSFTQH